MKMKGVSTLALLFGVIESINAHNSTYTNPILPGFHPDPSCIFVPEWDDTFFCASSSFLVFPGLQIHATRDLQQFKLISNALNRPTQLPGLNGAKRATSGIWAPTLRYRDGTFYLITSIVYDDYPKNDTTRFDAFFLTSTDPYNSSSWSDLTHFNFPGYDVSLFWDDDGSTYVTGTFAWEINPGIQKFPIDLATGEIGEIINIWNGTGASAPEGPHLYRKVGYYYLMIAEGGTGSGHMVTMARSESLDGPYEPHPHNPVLSQAGTTTYFQDVGHADLFQDADENWWAVALSVRQGLDGSYPMGRETSLTPVTWEEGQWPIFTNVSGHMNGWHLPPLAEVKDGEGSLVSSSLVETFKPGSSLPIEFVHWRFPVTGSYIVSPTGQPNTLQLTSSLSNLTGHDGRSAEPLGQTFIARRQVHSLFTFRTTFELSTLKEEEQEVGVTVFLDQLHYYALGIVMLPNSNSSKTTTVTPHLRLRSITTVPTFVSFDLPVVAIQESWCGSELTLQIQASNITHYEMSAGPAGKGGKFETIGFVKGLGLTWGFTGALLGAYATTNGGSDEFKTYVLNWEYHGEGQVVA